MRGGWREAALSQSRYKATLPPFCSAGQMTSALYLGAAEPWPMGSQEADNQAAPPDWGWGADREGGKRQAQWTGSVLFRGCRPCSGAA